MARFHVVLLSMAVVLLLAGCIQSSPPSGTDTSDAGLGSSTAGNLGGAGSTTSTSRTHASTRSSTTTHTAGDCPDPHWHAAFAVYVYNGTTPEGRDAPRRIDYAAPRANDGQAYYQLGEAPAMDIAAHLHQSGSETGSVDLGPAQFHFEGRSCIRLDSAFARLDTAVSLDGVATSGRHATVGQAGSWPASASHPLHIVFQAANGTWAYRPTLDAMAYQLLDGESVLIAVGNYSPQQVAAMEATVPVPMSRHT